MTQALIHPRHKDEAAKAAGYVDYATSLRYHLPGSHIGLSILAHAQTLANLEKARADLAEIDRIAAEMGWAGSVVREHSKIAAIAAPYRASDPQPAPPCPDCEAFRREVSDAICEAIDLGVSVDARTVLSRFIIPASDPVAEALKEAMREADRDEGEGETWYDMLAASLNSALASRGLTIIAKATT